MPIIVPRKVVPISEAKEAPAPEPTTGLSHEEVRAMLAEQAISFAQQIKAVTQAFSGALQAFAAQPKDKPVTGWDFKVEYRQNGAIETIRATPRKGATP
ncbi:MAG TPA: hypothetical protein PKY40_07745 [Burkholderiaceae bacterium]|nr:hypothetical protein [Burkholderiaceae bacterium]